MKTTVVMTIIGQDQPGLVEAVSAIIEAHHGNWEESRMARLEGEFAGILKVLIDTDQLPSLKQALSALSERGLQVVVAKETDSPTATPTGHHVSLEVVGNDHEGIIHRISQTLAAHQINVETLESKCESAPWSGETLFRATAELTVPPQTEMNALRDDLETIAAELMVDFTLNQSLQ